MSTSMGSTRKFFNILILFIKQSKWDSIDNGRDENLGEREGDIWKNVRQKQEGDGLHADSKLQFCHLEQKNEMMKRQVTNQARD